MVASGLRFRGCLVLAALLACGTAARPGRAEPPPRVALTWERAPSAAGCVTREAAVQMIQRRLRRPPFVDGSAGGADFTVAATLAQPARERWEATFVVTRADGSFVGRRALAVDAPSCRVLDGPMALVLTLLAEEPEHAAEPVAPLPASAALSAPDSPPPGPAPSAPPAPTPLASGAPAAASGPPAPREPLTSSLFAGATVTQGAVPGVDPGAKIGSTLGTKRWRARFEVAYVPGDTTPAQGPGVRVSLVQAGLEGCGRSGALVGPLSVEGCAGLRAGVARGAGARLSQETVAPVLVHGLTAHGALLWPLGPVVLRASLGAQVATARARFFYDTPAGSAVAWKASRVQPEADMALEFRWGP